MHPASLRAVSWQREVYLDKLVPRARSTDRDNACLPVVGSVRWARSQCMYRELGGRSRPCASCLQATDLRVDKERGFKDGYPRPWTCSPPTESTSKGQGRTVASSGAGGAVVGPGRVA